MCNSTTKMISPKLGQSLTVMPSSTYFVQNQVCYYQLQASDYTNGAVPRNDTMLEVKVNKISGVQFYINNSTTGAVAAANESSISTYSSTTLTLTPNMVYYLVVIAVDSVGTLNFTSRYYPTVPSCLDTQEVIYDNETIAYKCKDIPIPPPIIVNITKNVTVLKIVDLNGPTKPLYGSIIIMTIITFGFFFFLWLNNCLEKRNKRVQGKINTTYLTDFEMRPIEE